MSSEEGSARAFAVETVDWNEHQLTFVSMENGRFANNREICPVDRFDRVAEVIDQADLTVVEYFIPEIERTTYRLPLIGPFSKYLIGPDGQYSPIARIGHELGARMGSADIANKPLYAAYAMPMMFYVEYPMGNHCIEPRARERFVPTPTDARRMLTAEAIMQETARHPEGTHIAYIGAPAHANRVARYILQDQTKLDRARLALYRHMPGLHKSLRIYEPNGESWQLAEKHKITRKPLGKAALSPFDMLTPATPNEASE